MATQSDTKTSIQNAPAVLSIQSLIEASAKELGRALPDHLNPERLVRIALTCVRLNPELSKCTQESFLGALFTAAQLGLEPVGGRAYLIPFNNSRKKPTGEWHTVKECQMVIGFRGITELFYRHSKAMKIEWGCVKEDDDFDFEQGTNSYLRHRPRLGSSKPVIAYYAIATLGGDNKIFHVMSAQECLEHAKAHSKTWDKKKEQFYDGSPWATEPESMCKKTCLIQLAKLLPLSVELQRALQTDETSRDYRRGMADALDAPSTTSWNGDKPAIEPPAEPEPPADAPTGPAISQVTGKPIEL